MIRPVIATPQQIVIYISGHSGIMPCHEYQCPIIFASQGTIELTLHLSGHSKIVSHSFWDMHCVVSISKLV